MALFKHLTTGEITALVATALIVYLTGLYAYRLLLHPLRSFPGEKLAALSEWHWCYHAKNGSSYLSVLHQKYGPVVRIAPNSLHFSDYRAYHDIYSPGSKFIKDRHYYNSFDQEECSFGWSDPQLAKARRDVLSPLFSRSAILKLENVVQEKVDLLFSQILVHSNLPIDLSYAFRSVAMDIISSYCFAECYSLLTYPNFQHPMLRGMDSGVEFLWVLLAFPFLLVVLPWLEPVMGYINTDLKADLDVRARLTAQVDKLLKDPGSLEGAEHEIIYHHLMNPKPGKSVGDFKMPSRTSLIHESENLLSAGSDTVGITATVGTFHVLSNERIQRLLVQELTQAWPELASPMSLAKLEKLPYLTAVIKESLRMSGGVLSPLPRIVRPNSTVVAGVTVPAGTSISICSTFVHFNADIFTDPTVFNPERWLQPDSAKLDNFQVAFSRGPRSCLGINLAWCELYLIFATLFRKLDMELYETSADDLKYKEYFLPAFAGHLRARVSAKTS
ncbi:cytochrome P450 [Athelia psychrophila]|uniref:Cytochrome P450 n=1 Tax=Athelia psychrophila TaxID=1759441 RepID=A0A166UPW0_9AGAM|nr:cytochrome P450 [Fibularhizoctonia sp. CBS 109695]